MMSQPGLWLAKQFEYTFCPISQGVKATRQWNLVS